MIDLLALAGLAVVGIVIPAVVALRNRRAHAALPAAPAEHRSLDQGQLACKHPRRAVSVVPARGDAPVGWLCPDCLATMPEPQPLGPRTPSGHPSADDGTFGLGAIRAGSITASKITAGSITMSEGGIAVLPDVGARGQDGYRGPDGPTPETYEVRSHQSDYPVRTFTTAPASITYANREADRARLDTLRAAILDVPDGDAIRRANLVEFMWHGGHTHDQIVAALADWDRRQTSAEPVHAAVKAGIATPNEARALLSTGLGRGWPADDISSLL